MILVDTNLLVYAWNRAAPEHERAAEWLEGRLSDVAGVGMAWTSLLGFVRLVTHPRIFERPAHVSAAWAQVEEWLALPNVFAPEPGRRYPEILGALIREVGRPEHVPDAHLAALSMEYGLTLQSTDRDFARFRGLKWQNPLES